MPSDGNEPPSQPSDGSGAPKASSQPDGGKTKTFVVPDLPPPLGKEKERQDPTETNEADAENSQNKDKDKDDLKWADRTRYFIGVVSISVGVWGAYELTTHAFESAADMLKWIEKHSSPHFPHVLAAKAAIAGTAFTFCTLLVTTGHRLLRPLWWVREYDRERIKAKTSNPDPSIMLAELLALSRGDRLPLHLRDRDRGDE